MRRLGPLLLLSALLVPAAARSQTAAEHIKLGDAEHALFKPATALQQYEAAIALDPSNGEALGKASRASVDLGEQATESSKRTAFYKNGEQYARRAVEASPNDPEVYFHLSRALGRTALSVGVRERIKYATEIRSVALKALKLDPNHPGALHVMGVWNAEVMRISGFERFLAKNLLGGRVFGEANWKDAQRYMEKAVSVDPARLTHHLDLARIYVDVKEKAKARQQFEFVLNGPLSDYNDPVYKREAEAELKRLK